MTLPTPQALTADGLLDSRTVQSFFADQLASEPKDKATRSHPMYIPNDDQGKPYFLFIDWLLGYVVKLTDFDAKESTGVVEFYTVDGSLYIQNTASDDPLPLPVSQYSLNQYYNLLVARDPRTYHEETDTYYIQQEGRDTLNRVISIRLNEAENGVLITYSATKKDAKFALGQTDLPTVNGEDDDGTTDSNQWVYTQREVIVTNATTHSESNGKSPEEIANEEKQTVGTASHPLPTENKSSDGTISEN